MDFTGTRCARTALGLGAFFLLAATLVNLGLVSQRAVREAGPVVVTLGLLLWFISDWAVAQGRRVTAGARVASDRSTTNYLSPRHLAWESATPRLALALFGGLLAVTLGSLDLVIPFSAKPVPVLTYHRVGRAPHDKYPVPVVSPEEFRRQVVFLKSRGYQTVSPEQLLRYWAGEPVDLPRRPLLITFDDGWRDNYRLAYPILKEMGFTAVIFVATAEADQRGMLRWPEVRRLANDGFTIASHSHQHLNLQRLTREERARQLSLSLAVLRRRAGLSTTLLSYPYGGGDLDSSVWSDMARVGLSYGFASHNFGINVRRPNPFAVRRILISGGRWIGRAQLYLLLW